MSGMKKINTRTLIFLSLLAVLVVFEQLQFAYGANKDDNPNEEEANLRPQGTPPVEEKKKKTQNPEKQEDMSEVNTATDVDVPKNAETVKGNEAKNIKRSEVKSTKENEAENMKENEVKKVEENGVKNVEEKVKTEVKGTNPTEPVATNMNAGEPQKSSEGTQSSTTSEASSTTTTSKPNDGSSNVFGAVTLASVLFLFLL